MSSYGNFRNNRNRIIQQTVSVEPIGHPRIVDFIKYLKAINDDEIRPVIIPFEVTTTAGGAAPADPVRISVPQDRHYYLYGIFGHIEPTNANPINSEANISELVTVDVTINESEKLFYNPVTMAEIIGTPLYPKDGLEFKFPFHIRPKVEIAVRFRTANTFPAAVRKIGVAFNAILLKEVGSGM